MSRREVCREFFPCQHFFRNLTIQSHADDPGIRIVELALAVQVSVWPSMYMVLVYGPARARRVLGASIWRSHTSRGMRVSKVGDAYILQLSDINGERGSFT